MSIHNPCSGYPAAAARAERETESNAIGAGVVRIVQQLADGGSHNFKALGFADIPELVDKTPGEVSELLGRAFSDLQFRAIFTAGEVRNYEALAEKTAENFPET